MDGQDAGNGLAQVSPGPAATTHIHRVAVVLNGAAGALLTQPDARDKLEQLFETAGLVAEFVPPDAGTLPERIDIACALQADAVVVAGGDGTVACAADRLADTGIAMGVLPFGTMNLLAKDLKLPIGDVAAAVRVLAEGEIREIDVGCVNGRAFLCASMLGLPARLARHREAHRGQGSAVRLWSRFGSAAMRAFTRQFRLRMEMRIDGKTTALKVPSVTIAVNALDTANSRMFARTTLDGGELAVYVIDRLHIGDVLRLAARLVGGRLLDDAVLSEVRARAVTISRRRGAFRVMNDGEVVLMDSPLRYRIRPRALRVIAPIPRFVTIIAHISDLHFGAEDDAAVASLSAELVAMRPGLVAISGDLTMGARMSEFRAARAFIDGLGLPVLAVPGNHDITPYHLLERFLDPYARWRRTISIETEPVWQDDEVAVFGLNTARRLGLHWDWSRGRITSSRLRRLEERMAAQAGDRARIVVAHHPLLPPEGAPETNVVGGSVRAMAAFGTDNVALVLSGHLHRGYSRVAAPGVKAPMILQASTATSVRLRGEPNAFNLVEIGANGIPHVQTRIWQNGAWTTTPGTAKSI